MSVNFTNNNNIFNEFNKISSKNPVADNSSFITKEIQKDSVELSTGENFDYSIDDGKISLKEKVTNFGKGIISPITTMFSSPKNFLIGAATIAASTALIVGTGGAAAPVLVTAGLIGGGIQLGKSAYTAATAKTDEEARQAWQGLGMGTTAVVGSVAGAKSALKASNVNTQNMSVLKATTECIKQSPKSVLNSAKSFTNGEFIHNLSSLTNIKNKNINADIDENQSVKQDIQTKTAAKSNIDDNASAQVQQTKTQTKATVDDNAAAQAQQQTKAQTKATVDDNASAQAQQQIKAQTKATVDDNAAAQAQQQTKAQTKATVDDNAAAQAQQQTKTQTKATVDDNAAAQAQQQTKTQTKATVDDDAAAQAQQTKSTADIAKRDAEFNRIINNSDKMSAEEIKKILDTDANNDSSITFSSEQKVTLQKLYDKKIAAEQQAALALKNKQDNEALATKILDEHFDEIENLLLDENGKIGFFSSREGKRINASFDELLKPLDEDLGTIYHGTTAENKAAILKEGFRTDLGTQHGSNGVGGTYFTRQETNLYGDNTVRARFNGKVAVANTDYLDDIKNNTSNRIKIGRYINKLEGKSSDDLFDSSLATYVMEKYMRRKINDMGYQGILGSNYSLTAQCRYFSALDPSLIEIIE